MPIKVIPSSLCTVLQDGSDDVLKVKMRSSAERDRANTAAVKLVAESLGLKKGKVLIMSGETSVRKELEITAMNDEEIFQKLENL